MDGIVIGVGTLVLGTLAGWVYLRPIDPPKPVAPEIRPARVPSPPPLNQPAAPLEVVPAAQEEQIPNLDPPLPINERAEEPAVAPPAAPADTRVDYDVVVDIRQIGIVDFPVSARDRETLAAFEEGFTGKTAVSWGAYNAGKTFVLGRIFKVTFRAESLTERTKALSYKRFPFGNTQEGQTSRYFLVIDCAGNSTPTNAEEDMVLLDKFATEKFLHEFAYLSSDYILLVFDCGSWDNIQKILYHRRRAFKNKEQKEIFVVFNWKQAKTAETLKTLVQEEIVDTYQNFGTLQLDENGEPDFFHLKENKEKGLATAKIFWFGDDGAEESRQNNTRAAGRIFDMIKNIEVFKQVQPLQQLYRETGVDYNGSRNRL